MTNVDQFESVFRSASKPVFHPRDIDLERALVVTDLAEEAAQAFSASVRRLLLEMYPEDTLAWETFSGKAFASQGELLERVHSVGPDLVITYRHLHSDGWRWPYSLGEYLDVLTQVSEAPVLVCPNPEELAPETFVERGLDRVMAVTDHLAGDDKLVNWAVKITARDGRLYLAHVEDQAAYDRMIDVISKIPALDTDVARRTIREQLLKEPHDYIRSCREQLEKADAHVAVMESISMGHHLADYRRLVTEHEIDVLVLNTKDDDQLAMHGIAYSLAVEQRDLPQLLL